MSLINGGKNTFFLNEAPLDFSRDGATYERDWHIICSNTRTRLSHHVSLQFRCIAEQCIGVRCWIPPPMDFGFIHQPSNLGLFFIRQLHLEGTPILFKILNLLGPGMGMISSPCANNHANVSCPAVTFLFFAISASFSTNYIFLKKFSSENRGVARR